MASETPHYMLSQDYERMLVLLETGPLLGFVNYDPGDNLRDPVQIKRLPYPGGQKRAAGLLPSLVQFGAEKSPHD